MPCAVLAMGLLSGCSSMDKLFYKQEVVTTPGAIIRTNTITVTNVVVVEIAKTNALTGEITAPKIAQIITPTITYDYAAPVCVTNLVPSQAIQGGIAATGALPLPGAGAIALGLGWLYSLYASIRNKKVAAGVVMSVERAREFLQTTPEGQALDGKVRDILKQHQESAGIATAVSGLLRDYVDPTKKAS